jgi:hypothetical protein
VWNSSLRTRLATGALFMFAVTIALVLLEIGAGVILGENLRIESDSYREHPSRIFTHVSNKTFVHTLQVGKDETVTMDVALSSQGLRDRDYAPKQENEYRILMVGDSHTFGHGLSNEQTIPKVLEGLFARESTEKKIAVINGGTQGYGVWQEADWLDEIGFSLEPDLVILQLFSNDFNDSLSKVGKSLNSDEWRRRLEMFRSQQLWHVKAERWLRERSHAYTLSLRVTHERPWVTTLLEKTPFITAELKREEVVDTEGRSWMFEFYLRDWTPPLEEAWGILKSDILAIRDACNNRHIAFAAYMMPTCSSVFETDFWDKGITQSVHGAKYQRGKAERVVEEFLTENSIASFSLMEVFATYDHANTIYYEEDGHLRPIGAKVVAEHIKEFLMDEPQNILGSTQSTRPDLTLARASAVNASGPSPQSTTLISGDFHEFGSNR